MYKVSVKYGNSVILMNVHDGFEVNDVSKHFMDAFEEFYNKAHIKHTENLKMRLFIKELVDKYPIITLDVERFFGGRMYDA